MGLENTNPNPGATDRGDFRIMPTGGSILTDPNWPADSEIVAILDMELSTYNGNLDSDWACGRADIFLGSSPIVLPPPVPLEIDIEVMPNEEPGCLDIDGEGVVPVAILGCATLDVTMVDTGSLVFAGLDVALDGSGGLQCSIEDSNNDGISDLVCNFADDENKWVPDSDTAATLTGKLLEMFGGTSFQGTDEICLVPRKKSSSTDPVFLALLSLIVLLRRRQQR